MDLGPPVPALLPETQVTASVTDLGNGRWRVGYRFAAPARAAILPRSEGDYRRDTWTALDGARLERIGGYDVMLFDGPVFQTRFEIEPYTGNLEADYTPFTPFSDGSVFLFTGQFEAMPLSDPAQLDAARAEGRLDLDDFVQPRMGVRVHSSRPMVAHGRPVTGVATDTFRGGGSFVYVGDGEIVTGASFTGVLDPGLPDWLMARFDSDLERIFGIHERLWGYELTEKATVLFAFGGYGHGGFSNVGGVLGTQLALEASGDAFRTPNEMLLGYLLWFFAHEAAHVFQRGPGINGADIDVGWIDEGSANAMANRIAAQLVSDGDAFLRRAYGMAISQCAGFLKDGPLAEAPARGQFQAFYECGDLLSVLTEAALPDHDLFAFFRELQARAWARPDREYDPETWFTVMADLGAAADDVARIRRLVEAELGDPQAELLAALTDLGLAPRFENGRLTAIRLPWM